MTHDMPSKKQLSNWMKQYVVSQDEELSPEKQEEVKRLMEFFERYGITFEKFDPKRFSVFNSIAYPNYDGSSHVPGQHDTNKWLMTVKNIRYKQKGGVPYKEAIQESTQGWKKMEIYDFLNWLKYYEEGAHMKYKFAQTWYVNDSMPGYFVPMNKPEEQKTDDANLQAAQQEEKKQIIAQQRKKILSRLDSIRKMLRSQDGHTFAGDELETLLEAVHTLEKKISTLNKLSTSIRLYEDMIVREANVLCRNGFNKAADMLYAAAQTPGAAGQSATGKTSGGIDIPPPAAPADPSGAGQRGTAGGINENPGTPNAQSPAGGPETTPESKGEMIPQEETQPLGIQQFMEAMNGQEGKSLEPDDDLAVDDQEEELMVSEAQATNMPAAALEDIPMTTDPAPVRGNPAELPQNAFVPEEPKTAPTPVQAPIVEEPLEVTEADIPVKPPEEGEVEVERPASDIDSKMDSIMSNVSMEDIVLELENLAKVFKVREIPRRLALIDMLLDAKGLSSYFGNLSEAQAKALESNNYISSRIEDILSKLRGSIATRDIDLEGQTQSTPTDAYPIKAKLEQDANKEKERKQLRKQQENAELEAPAKEVPQVDMEELTPPASPQIPVAPQKPAAV